MSQSEIQEPKKAQLEGGDIILEVRKPVPFLRIVGRLLLLPRLLFILHQRQGKDYSPCIDCGTNGREVAQVIGEVFKIHTR